MSSFAAARKRGRPDGAIGNGGVPSFKRSKEMDSTQPGLGSKSKPCTKFFSTAGCPFGAGCHFMHYVHGGYNTVSHTPNLGNPVPRNNPPMGAAAAASLSDGSTTPAAKTRLCNKYNTPEGCKFGEKCRFAHGERELGRPLISSNNEAPTAMGMGMGMGMGMAMGGGKVGGGRGVAAAAAASFGASATAKISVDGSLAGIIIGKGGVNTKQVCRTTGAKLSIRDHESDPNLKNIEMEGTFDQIKQASAMVRELIVNISSGGAAAVPVKPITTASGGGGGGPRGNYKTKECENFAKGTCTFGDRCHFAHGTNELRKPTIV